MSTVYYLPDSTEKEQLSHELMSILSEYEVNTRRKIFELIINYILNGDEEFNKALQDRLDCYLKRKILHDANMKYFNNTIRIKLSTNKTKNLYSVTTNDGSINYYYFMYIKKVLKVFKYDSDGIIKNLNTLIYSFDKDEWNFGINNSLVSIKKEILILKAGILNSTNELVSIGFII